MTRCAEAIRCTAKISSRVAAAAAASLLAACASASMPEHVGIGLQARGVLRRGDSVGIAAVGQVYPRQDGQRAQVVGEERERVVRGAPRGVVVAGGEGQLGGAGVVPGAPLGGRVVHRVGQARCALDDPACVGEVPGLFVEASLGESEERVVRVRGERRADRAEVAQLEVDARFGRAQARIVAAPAAGVADG